MLLITGNDDTARLARVKGHLSIVHSLDDTKISEIIVHASDIVQDYLKKTDLQLEEEWSNTSPISSPPDLTIPGRVEAATLMVCAAIYENREGWEGGGSVSSFSMPDPLSKTIKALLHRTRDPAMA
jgi:hypothetical protein